MSSTASWGTASVLNVSTYQSTTASTLRHITQYEFDLLYYKRPAGGYKSTKRWFDVFRIRLEDPLPVPIVVVGRLRKAQARADPGQVQRHKRRRFVQQLHCN